MPRARAATTLYSISVEIAKVEHTTLERNHQPAGEAKPLLCEAVDQDLCFFYRAIMKFFCAAHGLIVVLLVNDSLAGWYKGQCNYTNTSSILGITTLFSQGDPALN